MKLRSLRSAATDLLPHEWFRRLVIEMVGVAQELHERRPIYAPSGKPSGSSGSPTLNLRRRRTWETLVDTEDETFVDAEDVDAEEK